MIINQLSEDPWIWSIPNFLSDTECDYFIKLAENRLRPSELHKKGVIKEIRSSSSTSIPVYFDKTIKEIEDRLALLTEIPLEYSEQIQIVNYQPNQHYDVHYDFLDPKDSQDHINKYGQRITTVLMYLNTVEEGGYTLFPNIGLEVWPIKGNAIMWHNMHPTTGELDTKTAHEAQPVIKGEKWIATKWFRNLPFQTIT